MLHTLQRNISFLEMKMLYAFYTFYNVYFCHPLEYKRESSFFPENFKMDRAESGFDVCGIYSPEKMDEILKQKVRS